MFTLDVVIFEGNQAASPVEKMLVQARHAALTDNVDKLLSLEEVERVFLVTNQPHLLQISKDRRFYAELNHIPPAQFHFGTRLLELVEKHRIRTVLYMGGAAVPLIHRNEFAMACKLVMEGERRYVTNNVQSADLLAFNSCDVLKNFPLPPSDNALVMMLRYDAGFEQRLLPVTLGTQFDIDTPSDLLILAATTCGGPNLRSVLGQLALDLSSVLQLKDILRGHYLELALIGRVGAPVIAAINSNFRLRLRIFSEERGMKALGRLDRGEVVSLLGYWLEEIGPERFFRYLAQTVQAALIDSRVLMAHLCRDVSDADRFHSDLSDYEKISDPWIREFTRAAVHCPIPVLLGGHSLVSGCIWALVEDIGCLI